MPYERTGYAPWSLTREAGVQSATVDGTIQVPQYIQPTLSTGFIDEDGNWKGTRASDEVFKQLGKEVAVPNGQEVLIPGGDPGFLDMTGFNHLMIAIKPSNGGNFAIQAVMGPDTNSFANLTPIVAAGAIKKISVGQNAFAQAVDDSAENLTAGAWNIMTVYDVLSEQKVMQIKCTNNSGNNSDIEFGFMRLV